MPYHTVLPCTVLPVPCLTILCCHVLCCLYRALPYCAAHTILSCLYCVLPYCADLYCAACTVLCCLYHALPYCALKFRGCCPRPPQVRQGLKEYSKWPTYPQVYVKGELLGGCDIVLEMAQAGELKGTVQGMLEASS